ncbi:hypothetical protein LTR36_008531 [Oleoguttula mirabilis]|uniref:DDH domain-containing protein n=1 Tax=Oleoguttula mirabilis TaxID=1507867 RepID=A0AAV9JSU0_9PEZI|nr:hypothetical protein LTR36_008531 [Oleoguttula mirabilis]
MALSAKIGSTTLSVQQYMALAAREPRVATSDFAEWLTDTYTYDNGVMVDSSGIEAGIPVSRPGWFDLHDVDERGIPRTTTRSAALDKWKFWSLEDPSLQSGAMRSFVTSSGTCSLDLGVPIFARHPLIMIREAYKGPPPKWNWPLDRIWADYQALMCQKSKDDAALERLLFELRDNDFVVEDDVDSLIVDKRREVAADLKGKRRILLDDFGGLVTIDIDRLRSALPTCNDTVETVVLGHAHPDADALVSAVFEAARRNLDSGSRTCAAWAESIPPEVAHILGPVLCDCLTRKPPDANHALVLVDCQNSPHSNAKLVKAVIDHHPCVTTYPYYVAQSYETSWSSTLQVYIKLLGSGFDLDPTAAKMLAEATVLEAEPELMFAMGKVDRLAMERLKRIAAPMTSYPDLMAIMTGSTNRDYQFSSDYKSDGFGFAVIKSRQRQPSCFTDLSQANNMQEHLPLTIIKQVLYDVDFSAVHCEVITATFNPTYHDKGFRRAVIDVVQQACIAFHGQGNVMAAFDTVTVTAGRSQTPRLLLMPLIKRLVDEHLSFAYSNRLDRYVACGFYCGLNDGAMYGEPGSESTVRAQLCH